MNQTSRLHIDEVTNPERKDVLDTYACAELNVHLNSFYVQLRGALDNLAWTLHYEFKILGTKDETDSDTRSKCGLFEKRFVRPLETLQPALAAVLREKQRWFRAFKEFRDPVAHRVPLYAMPGVIREGSQENNPEAMRDKLFESFAVGRYEPWFTHYGPDGYVIRDIRVQTGQDHDEFLAISEAVLSSVFA